MLSCKHLMHGSCFVRMVSEQSLHAVCDADFGGPRYCAVCLDAVPRGFVSTALHRRDEVLRYFSSNYVKRYALPYSALMASAELTDAEKRDLLGVTRSMFSADRTDYTAYGRRPGCLAPDEVAADLVSRGRTLSEIFKASTFNAQHLQRLGVVTLDAFLALGYDANLHNTPAYRGKCPLWMLVDLYGLDVETLLRFNTADQVLAGGFLPKELWLAGVSIGGLVARGLTKAGLLRYMSFEKIAPADVESFLDLEAKHVLALGIRAAELPDAWKQFARTNRQLAILVSSQQQ